MLKRNGLKTVCTLIACSLVLSMFPVSVSAAAAEVAVDWEKEYQTMDGFGAAEAFNKAAPLHSMFSPAVSKELLDLTFGEENGIGLDIFRLDMGDGGTTWGNSWYDGPHDTIWPTEEGGYVWDQPDWAAKKADFNAANIWMMKEVQKRGVNTFYIDAWSPPGWMKTTGVVNGGTLKPEYYDEYADYLVNYALGYWKEFGIPVTHIGATNESEVSHSGYSGQYFRGAEYQTFMEQYLRPTLDRYVSDGAFADAGIAPPLIVGPEGTSLAASVSSSNWGTALSGENSVIDVFSTHLYGTSSFNNGPLTASAGNSTYPGWLRSFTLWQTEYMARSGNSSAADMTQTYASTGIADGLKWTNLMTNLITSDPGFNAYLWWWAIGNNGADGSDLLRLQTTGSPQGNGSTVTGEYRTFKRLYTVGQFSRFVDPGDVRIDATRVPAASTNVVAFKDAENDELKIVVTNQSADSRDITFSLDNLPDGFTAESMVPFRTSASENQIKLDPVAIHAGRFTATVPAQSVVTFVSGNSDKAALKGLSDRRDIFSTLEAEASDGMSEDYGTVSAGNRNALSGASNGGYIKFANVNFADGSANGGIVRRHILSMNAIAASLKGGQIEVRIDDPDTGRIVGTFSIPGKDDPASYASYPIQIDTGDNAAYGIHDVYMVFRGNGDELFNIDRFEFGEQYIAPASLLTNGSFESLPGSAWASPGGSASTTYTRTNAQNYSAPVTASSSTNAYSLQISNRSSADEGAAQTVTGLVDGAPYKVSAFFMPSAAGADGQIKLVAYNAAGEAVDTQVIAQRSGLKPMVWSQVDAAFTYHAPDADFTTLKLVLTDTSTNTLYLDEAVLTPFADKSGLLALLDNGPDLSGPLTPEELDRIDALTAEGWDLVADPSATWDEIRELTSDIRDAFMLDVVWPTGVTIDGSSLLMLRRNASVQLSATISPAEATFAGVTWSSSNAGVASIDPETGLLKALAPGSAVITATSERGGFTDTVTVRVNP